MSIPELEGIELPDDLLEGISGGELTEGQMSACLDMCVGLKKAGFTLKRAQDFFMRAEDETLRQDLVDYVASIWETL